MTSRPRCPRPRPPARRRNPPFMAWLYRFRRSGGSVWPESCLVLNACNLRAVTCWQCANRAHFVFVLWRAETRKNSSDSRTRSAKICGRLQTHILAAPPKFKSMFFRERLDFIQRVDFPPRRWTSGPASETPQPLECFFFLALLRPAFLGLSYLLYLLF